MIQIQRKWLGEAPWQTVVSLNEALCQAKQVPHKLRHKAYDETRSRWEQSHERSLTLIEALDLCRSCQNLAPFDFFNANTFTAIGKTMLEDGLSQLPPLEAQIIRTTVAHYIAGQIHLNELKSVLAHFENLWQTKATSTAKPAPPKPPASPHQTPPRATA